MRVRLGRGSRVHFTYSAHARNHMRAARFWLAVDVRTLGLGLGLGLRILGLRVYRMAVIVLSGGDLIPGSA